MSGYLLRGALVEYNSHLMGPIPNVVFFQFNPEQFARTIQIAEPPMAGASGRARQREPAQATHAPSESFTLTAHFSAADDLGRGGALSVVPRLFGVGPQLAALEKMAYPPGPVGGAIGQAVDAIGGALGLRSGRAPASRSVPRETLPRLLLVWGASRVLPVRIKSLAINEQKFDAFLNPVQAEVQVGFDVVSFAPSSTDTVGKGALLYTRAIKDAQVVANLQKSIESAIELIPF
jgi:hypothetical protein